MGQGRLETTRVPSNQGGEVVPSPSLSQGQGRELRGLALGIGGKA